MASWRKGARPAHDEVSPQARDGALSSAQELQIARQRPNPFFRPVEAQAVNSRSRVRAAEIRRDSPQSGGAPWRCGNGTKTAPLANGCARVSSADSASGVACRIGTGRFALVRTVSPLPSVKRFPPRSGSAAPIPMLKAATVFAINPSGKAGFTIMAMRAPTVFIRKSFLQPGKSQYLHASLAGSFPRSLLRSFDQDVWR
ncbi:hypothetical protein ACVWW1_003485 [Bradyrhizobium sp. JR3.5]